MKDDELDRILSGTDEIVPSSGFVDEVMEAVRREAVTPPPIPFPWKRALPGLAAWAIVLVSVVVAAFLWPRTPPSPEAASAVNGVLEAASSAGAGWIVLALLVAFVSVKLSMRLAGAGR